MDISSLTVGIFTGLLQYGAILVQKLGGEENCQNPFPAILRLKQNEKNTTAIKLGGGG